MSLNHNFVQEASRFLGCAFVSFKYQHYRDIILELFETNPDSMQFHGEKLRLSKAFNPTEVLWENLALTDNDRRKRGLVAHIIIFLVVLVTFAVLLGVYLVTYYFQGLTEKIGYYSISLASTVLVVFIGYIIQLIIYQLVRWERHQTITNAKFSLVRKLVTFSFMNNAMVYFIIFFIRGGTAAVMKQRFGIINQVSFLLVVSAALQIVFNILNIGHLMARIKLWWKYRSK